MSHNGWSIFGFVDCKCPCSVMNSLRFFSCTYFFVLFKISLLYLYHQFKRQLSLHLFSVHLADRCLKSLDRRRMNASGNSGCEVLLGTASSAQPSDGHSEPSTYSSRTPARLALSCTYKSTYRSRISSWSYPEAASRVVLCIMYVGAERERSDRARFCTKDASTLRHKCSVSDYEIQNQSPVGNAKFFTMSKKLRLRTISDKVR